MKRKSIIRVILICTMFLITGWAVLPSFAQEKLPVRTHTSPDEMISLSKEMTFAQALDVLNTYSMKYDKKLILNRTSVSGPIGISLPSMYWFDALKYLGEINRFQIVPHDKYYELDPVSVEKSKSGPTSSGSGSSGGKKQVNTSTKEVLISATFFEGNRDALLELGIDWSTFKDGVVKIASNSASQVSNNQFSVDVSPFEIGNSGIKVQGLFQAFQSNDLGQIISQPTIKVIDGEEGHIQVGQTFFVNQKDFSGNTVSRSYNVGTILTVTPHVITLNDTTFVDLNVHGERSSLQPNSVSPTVNKQSSDSDILLLSGESTAIAGLYETTTSHIRKGIPFLKDLPPWFFGLRYLFGYNSKKSTQQELIILIKATIVPDISKRLTQEKKTMEEILREKRKEMQKTNEAMGKDIGATQN